MKYYAVVQLNISDDSWMADYMPNVTALVEKHGGTYLARTMTMEQVEGSGELPNAFIIIEWPSKEAATTFYSDPAYQPYLQSRLAGSSAEFVLVAGEDIAKA
jgi:uncharacterized protein (DUF1330 family)